jgi:hypothetical protein
MHPAINVLQSSRHRVRFWTLPEPPLRLSPTKKAQAVALLTPPLFTDFSRTALLHLHPSTHDSTMVLPLHPCTSRYDTPPAAQAAARWPPASMSRSMEASTGNDSDAAATLLFSTLFIRNKVCHCRGLLVQRNHSWSCPCCRSDCSRCGAAPLPLASCCMNFWSSWLIESQCP